MTKRIDRSWRDTITVPEPIAYTDEFTLPAGTYDVVELCPRGYVIDVRNKFGHRLVVDWRNIATD